MARTTYSTRDKRSARNIPGTRDPYIHARTPLSIPEQRRLIGPLTFHGLQAGAPSSDSRLSAVDFEPGDICVDTSGVVWFCTTAGTGSASEWRPLSGGATTINKTISIDGSGWKTAAISDAELLYRRSGTLSVLLWIVDDPADGDLTFDIDAELRPGGIIGDAEFVDLGSDTIATTESNGGSAAAQADVAVDDATIIPPSGNRLLILDTNDVAELARVSSIAGNTITCRENLSAALDDTDRISTVFETHGIPLINEGSGITLAVRYPDWSSGTVSVAARIIARG